MTGSTAVGKADPAGPTSAALEMSGIKKSYGPTEVLHGIDLSVKRGSIHALVGANGAGKSTLLKIAVGATHATSGRMMVGGVEHRFVSTVEARRNGIGMVFQERSVLPELSVADNVFLNDERRRNGLIDTRGQVREANEIFQRLGVEIDPKARVSQLGVGDQQMVEIAKALRLAKSVLILDEPTAALTEREVKRLFSVLRQIARSGVGIVYVSHRLAEIFDLCDEITVLRDGRVVMSAKMVDTNMQGVVDAIAGRAIESRHKTSDKAVKSHDATPVLTVRDLNVGTKLSDVSFDARPGEILGVAGLAGSGRSTLLKGLYGAVPRHGGSIALAGKEINPTSPAQALRQGLCFIPEDRKRSGLVLSHSVEDNVVLSILGKLRRGPLFNARASAQITQDNISQLGIKASGRNQRVERLSGGNQQKVVLAKAFNAGGQLLLLDEPTFGVDVHAANEITDRVRDFVDAGNAAIWVTSDLLELTRVADRILILADGTVREVVANWPEPLSESDVTHLIQPRSHAGDMSEQTPATGWRDQ